MTVSNTVVNEPIVEIKKGRTLPMYTDLFLYSKVSIEQNKQLYDVKEATAWQA